MAGVSESTGYAERDAPHRVVLTSIGDAGFSHLPVLRRLHPAADTQLARMLLQAPSELAVLEDAAAAEAIVEMLNTCGLRAMAQPVEAPFVPGRGEFDIALHLDDPAHAEGVIALIAAVLGTPPHAARELLFASPPALLGDVSAATVEALAARFAALGATLVASERATARYDLLVEQCPPRVRAHLSTTLGSGFDGGAGGGASETSAPLVLEDLDRATAERLLAELARSASRPVAIDRAFERFEVRVETCPATDEAARCLVELTGMPATVAARIPENVPIVLLDEVERSVMLEALAALEEVGARAVAEMATFRLQRLRIEKMARAEPARRAIERVTGSAPEPIGALPHVLEAALSPPRIRWLALELEREGVATSVVSA